MFVDINMPDLSGVEFVRSLEKAPMIIFTTAYSEYAVESFRLDAIDYLLKPFPYEDFSHAVKKAISLAELISMKAKSTEGEASLAREDKSLSTDENDCISIKADYKVSLVKFVDIIYIESVGEYIRIHLANGRPITTLFRLKNMEQALPSKSFMRVHRSYIVNLNYVKGYARGRVYLSNDEYVPLSANYRDQFREFLDSKGI
jgi:two-component system LytT family response regulator